MMDVALNNRGICRKSAKKAVIFVALAISALTTACNTVPKPAPAVEQPRPMAADPRLCAAIEPEPPVQGGIVQPVTQEARDAVQAFLNGELDLLFWGRHGWQRAALAKTTLCP